MFKIGDRVSVCEAGVTEEQIIIQFEGQKALWVDDAIYFLDDELIKRFRIKLMKCKDIDLALEKLNNKMDMLDEAISKVLEIVKGEL